MNIAELIADKAPKVGRVKFIGIDGHGGSGKSTLAKLLATNLNATLIQTDDFASHDVPFEWYDKFVDAVLKPIISGAKFLNYERSKWWEDHQPEPVVNQPVTPIMIIEGVGALRQESREYLCFGIYVDTPDDICLARGIARDKDNGGKSLEEIAQMWHEWIAAENEYMTRDNPQTYSDVIIDGTISFEEQIIF